MKHVVLSILSCKIWKKNLTMFLDVMGPKTKVQSLSFYLFYTFVPLIFWGIGMRMGFLPDRFVEWGNFLGMIGATVLSAIVIKSRKLDAKNYLLCILTLFLPIIFEGTCNLISMIIPTALVARKISSK